MKTKFQSIVALFTENADVQIAGKEDWDGLLYSTSTSFNRYPSAQDLSSVLPIISNRDSWRLTISSANRDMLMDINSSCGNIGDEIDTMLLVSHIGDIVDIKYSITKRLSNKVLSIYNEILFLESMGNLSLASFLSGINNRLTGDLVLEMIGKSGFRSFSTKTINVVGEGHVTHLPISDDRESRLSIRKSYCQWNRNDIVLLPEDLYTTANNTALAVLFRKAACLLSAMFVCDNTNINNDLELRLCGYRTMCSVLNTSTFSGLQDINQFCDRWFAIYDWCYTGGYSSDRLSIARNIISLNIPIGDIVKVNESTLQAIKSNFKVFEQDNVRQYIKVRNEISKLLIELQEKVNGIVEGFTGEFKKNIVAIFSFFLTVVVVRVIAKGDFLGGFSNPIIYLSFIFIGISVVLLIYSRIELSSKESLFDKHYKQLRERYAPLLSEEEISIIFKDCDPKINGTHANYIKWQKKVYTWLWVASLVFLTIFLVGMLASNYLSNLDSCKITKAIMICCIKNILS